MQLQLAHLEGRAVPVPHEVPDEPAIFMPLFRALAIGYARGLHNGFVRSHIIDDADKSFVKDGKRDTQDIVQGRDFQPV
jgi:hypothetical protein